MTIDLGAVSAARLIAAASDVALVIDRSGVIRDVSFNKDDLALEIDGHGRWLGARLADVVTSESRPKVDELLKAAGAHKPGSWRQVNHPSPLGDDVPIQYSAVGIGRDDRIVVIGRDLRPLALMQQRLVSAQQSMERDYIKLRHAETRYRLLFEVAAEAVLVVDSASLNILDANPAALAIFDRDRAHIVKSSLLDHIAPDDRDAARILLGDIRATGRDGRASVRTASAGSGCTLTASLFRQENASLLLVRLSSQIVLPDSSALQTTALLRYFESIPDAMVITHNDGRIIRTNPAFLEMAQLSNNELAHGELLDRWVGRAGIDFGVALANLKQNGVIKLFSTVLRGQYGSITQIELSAMALTDRDDKPGYGFAIRNVEKRLASPAPARELPRSVAQLTDMIGRVPLKDLVRETTDVIEKLSIEAALELTGDNRASAAEMLGLSRQSLYVKLRRFGLAEQATEDHDE